LLFIIFIFSFFIVKREPLHIAAHQNFTEIAALLITNGALVNSRMIDGKTALYEATSGTDESSKTNGKKEIVKHLLENNADPSIGDLSGRTPIHWASFYGHSDVVELLLRHGADPSPIDDESVRPIHLGAFSGIKDIVARLIDAGADVNAVDVLFAFIIYHYDFFSEFVNFLRTPMHYAAASSSSAVLSYLLEHGANPDALDKHQRTPAMLIEGQNANELQELLQRHTDQSRPRVRSKNSSSSSLRG